MMVEGRPGILGSKDSGVFLCSPPLDCYGTFLPAREAHQYLLGNPIFRLKNLYLGHARRRCRVTIFVDFWWTNSVAALLHHLKQMFYLSFTLHELKVGRSRRTSVKSVQLRCYLPITSCLPEYLLLSICNHIFK